MPVKKGLGRGLDQLIPTNDPPRVNQNLLPVGQQKLSQKKL